MRVYRSTDFNITIGGNLSVHDLLEKKGVTVKPLPGKAPIVPITCLPLVHNESQYVWPSNNIHNLAQGVALRVLYVRDGEGGWTDPPSVSLDLKEYFKAFRWELGCHTNSLIPMTPEQYLLSCDPKRRKKYSSVLDQIFVDSPRRPSQFVKLEPAEISTKPAVARVITDPGPQTNFELGLYIKPAEAELVKAIKRLQGEHVIMKGMNAQDIALDLETAWCAYSDPVCLDGDASRFDAHTGIDIRKHLEFAFYTSMYPGDKILRALLTRLLKRRVRCRTKDGHFSYVLSSRGSGNHNTGIGNCLITVAILWTWLKQNGIRASPKVNGDDWIVIMERADLDKFQAGFVSRCLQIGYTMKVGAVVDVFEKIDFCQTSPVLAASGYIMVRNPITARVKDLTTYKYRTPKQFHSWCSAVSECGLAQSSGVPIYQDMYAAIKRTANGAKPGKYFDRFDGRYVLSKGLTYRQTTISSESRYSFWLAFGILPDDQESIEAEYRNSSGISFEPGILQPDLVEASPSVFGLGDQPCL